VRACLRCECDTLMAASGVERATASASECMCMCVCVCVLETGSVIGVIHANYSVNISRHITLGPPYCDPNILIPHNGLTKQSIGGVWSSPLLTTFV
jgi:hypothetical protein